MTHATGAAGLPCRPLLFPPMIHLKDAIAAANAYKEARSGNVANPVEVHRRANICSLCPMRRKIQFKATDQASKMLGHRANANRVPTELTDFKCGVCHCALMLLLPSLPEHLHRDSPEEAAVRADKAPGCWLPAAVASAQP